MSAFKDKLGQPQAWLQGLGLQDTDYRAAKLILLPAQNPWQTHSISEVQALLQNPLTGEQP
ncbi:MAG: hypothetical protein HC769_07210 [Cyanobacteria bacterium CRU_2_1]|nr:hypothetical protein [Cyanobacteria bacterium CRU_2_1]